MEHAKDHLVNVFVYADEGTSQMCVNATMQSLRTHLGANYAVQKISSSQVIEEPWEQTAALLVMPGGRDLPYLTKLSGKGNSRIKTFVENGGKYLGICAGGYYACDGIEFELGTPLEVKGKRELKFFNGIAKGCVYPNFKYNTEEGSKAAELDIDEFPEKIVVYYNGGCFFEAESSSNVKPLARYSDNKKIAAVECTVKKGLAILTGVHVEFSPFCLDPVNPFSEKILPDLMLSDSKRQDFFRLILQKLHLEVSKTPVPFVPELTSTYLLTQTHSEMMEIKGSIQQLDQKMLFKPPDNNSPSLKFLLQENESEAKADSSVVPIIMSKGNEVEIPFDYNQYMKNLQTKHYGRTVMFSDVVTSTQQLLKDYFMLFRELPDGLLFTASTQVAGVGRGSNVWVSPAGCLMFSLQIKFKTFVDTVFIQYLVALALVHSIRSQPQYEDLDIRIKWPNDIYYKNKKLSGILISSNYFGEFVVVVGVGFNLWNDKPSVCLNSIIQEYNKEHNQKLEYVSKEKMLAIFLNTFENFFIKFQNEGFQPFFSLYYKYWLHSNQRVLLQTDLNLEVTIQGISPTGFLLAKDDQNNSFELHPDGNSFDMMKGLIFKKTSQL